MSTVGPPAFALRQSPSTTGWPAVGIVSAVKQIRSSFWCTHAAARRMSPACSERALTLGMRRNSKRSSWMRWSFVVSQVSRSAGTVGFAVADIVTPCWVLREWLIAAGPVAVPSAQEPEALLRGDGIVAHEGDHLALVNAAETAGELADDARFVGLVVKHEEHRGPHARAVAEGGAEIVLVRPSHEIQREHRRMAGEMEGEFARLLVALRGEEQVARAERRATREELAAFLEPVGEQLPPQCFFDLVSPRRQRHKLVN